MNRKKLKNEIKQEISYSLNDLILNFLLNILSPECGEYNKIKEKLKEMLKEILEEDFVKNKMGEINIYTERKKREIDYYIGREDILDILITRINNKQLKK